MTTKTFVNIHILLKMFRQKHNGYSSNAKDYRFKITLESAGGLLSITPAGQFLASSFKLSEYNVPFRSQRKSLTV